MRSNKRSSRLVVSSVPLPPDHNGEGKASSAPAKVKAGQTPLVVGVGASAGGLEAFSQLLQSLPPDTGMAFVLIQHLDPEHESALAILLSKTTRMSVVEATDGVRIKPNCVYVIPPKKAMTLREGVLTLSPRPEGESRHLPIDIFFRSLVESRAESSIGIVLSGTGSDGLLGLQAIHNEGGVTLVQDPKSAKYDGMPRSAIAAGCADLILPPDQIAKELVRISRHSYVSGPAADEDHGAPGEDNLQEIFAILRKDKGIDFSQYKRGTILRRIQRRMVIHKVEKLPDYLAYLKDNPDEAEGLQNDLLIQVTRFFRDPETFKILKDRIFPEILRNKPHNDPLRLWVAGCSSGEEVYSLAICAVEFLEENADDRPIQVFGTDVNDKALEIARNGVYPENIEGDVSTERVHRFFTKKGSHLQIHKNVRDMCVFAKHNILKDPPFSKLDLISCRNVLIYLEAGMQKKALSVFHFALNPIGYIVFGTSETPGTSSGDLFEDVDKKWKIFSKKPSPPQHIFEFTLSPQTVEKKAVGHVLPKAGSDVPDMRKVADRVLLGRYAPASVIVNENLEILEFRGDTGPYLHNTAGAANLKLLRMADEGLVAALTTAFHKPKDAPFRQGGLHVEHNGRRKEVEIEVIPLKDPFSQKRYWAVMFDDSKSSAAKGKMHRPSRASKAETKEEASDGRWKLELASAKAYLQAVIDQKEAAIEELQTANEEALSSNEELQSLNEEMQAAKEELQASNEELNTLNDQLRRSNLETVTQMNDLHNFMESANVPVVMVGSDLRIRRFTPQAEEVLSLTPADVGRPVSDITARIHLDDLTKRITEVMDKVTVVEQEVLGRNGRWYKLQIRPYKTVDRKIDGAALVLNDIDALKRSEAKVTQERDYAEDILYTMREPFLVLNGELRVRRASPSFYSTFRLSPAETENKFVYELGRGQWSIPRLRDLLETVLRENSPIQDYELEHDFAGLGTRILSLNTSTILQGVKDKDKDKLILLAIEDITERRGAEERVKKLNAELETRVKKRTAELAAVNAELEAFSYSVAHNLRTPLREMSGFAQVLQRGYGDKLDEVGRRYFQRITAASKQMAQLIDDLLSLSRLARGEMEHEKVDLSLIAETVAAGLRKSQPDRQVDFQIAPEVDAIGDAGLLQMAIGNLLENAWKFTGKHLAAKIEFGNIKKDGKDVYFVRDDGAGFDVAYAHKMFEPFQRLHTVDEFPGTGVGLAIVQRIVRRHGGRIWAEGDVERGATFYFTLHPEGIAPY